VEKIKDVNAIVLSAIKSFTHNKPLLKIKLAIMLLISKSYHRDTDE
jgi:hypothetical protein